MKILITGGAGFIGSHIADTFIKAGHEVVILDNLSAGRIENIPASAKFYLLDVRSTDIEKVFEIEKIDAVCHQAAQMDVRRSVADPLYDADVNIKGSINLLENCVKFGVKKVLFASTGGAIYGEQNVFPCDESHPTNPVSPYGIAKLAVEKYLFYYGVEKGLNHVILRYANVYGPRQNPHGEAGVVAIFTSRLLAGEQPVINGDGGQTRDYVFVGDVAAANLAALNFATKHDVFNVGTGLETDVNVLFDHVNKLAGGKAKTVHGPAKPGEQRRSVISHEKIKKTLGWTPKTDLKEGLKRTVDFFKEREK